jgi:hypothetical protein
MKNSAISNRHRLTCPFLVAGVASLMLWSFLPHIRAQGADQKTFSSSKEAVSALIQAIRDENTGNLVAMLGPGSEEIVSSGDEVEDRNARRRFLERYDEKHALVASGSNELTLNVGNDDWPMPIPLVQNNGVWRFDGVGAKEEILYRRIGHNELSAIKVCKGVLAAQKDYAAAGHDGLPAGAFAQRIVSASGTQNGLFWEVKEGEPPSVAGPMLAHAAEEGYDTSGNRTPYHGYYYRILSAQGAAAPGGAKSYIQDGRMSGGFGLVAYPADYRSSGVMTFIVNQGGVIYEKDLGEKTSELAQSMTEYNPASGWKAVK